MIATAAASSPVADSGPVLELVHLAGTVRTVQSAVAAAVAAVGAAAPSLVRIPRFELRSGFNA